MIEIIFEGKDYYLGAGCACCMCSPDVQGAAGNTATISANKDPLPTT
jgi:hypothetical protein